MATRNALIYLGLLQVAFIVFAILIGVMAVEVAQKNWGSPDMAARSAKFLASAGWTLILIPTALIAFASVPKFNELREKVRLGLLVVLGSVGLSIPLYHACRAMLSILNPPHLM